MIPQSFKDIVSNGEYVGLLQTIAMILFLLVFLGVCYYVFNKPKKYYDEEASAPLDDNDSDGNDPLQN